MLLPPALGFSPHPPVSVYGTGGSDTIAAFLGTRSPCFPTLFRSMSRQGFFVCGFSFTPAPPLIPVFSLPAHVLRMRPHSSDHCQYRNLHLLSIGYAFQPRLRPRLTQGRSALPWNPWIFGRKDSHLTLATHSGILSSPHSTAPYRYGFFARTMLPYQRDAFRIPFLSFGGMFQPRTFSAQDLSTSELLRTL